MHSHLFPSWLFSRERHLAYFDAPPENSTESSSGATENSPDITDKADPIPDFIEKLEFEDLEGLSASVEANRVATQALPYLQQFFESNWRALSEPLQNILDDISANYIPRSEAYKKYNIKIQNCFSESGCTWAKLLPDNIFVLTLQKLINGILENLGVSNLIKEDQKCGPKTGERCQYVLDDLYTQSSAIPPIANVEPSSETPVNQEGGDESDAEDNRVAATEPENETEILPEADVVAEAHIEEDTSVPDHLERTEKTKESLVLAQGVDPGMKQFAEELPNQGERVWAGPLEGNGGRSVMIYRPPGFDENQPFEVLYAFHGTFSELIQKEDTDPNLKRDTLGWERLGTTLGAGNKLVKQGKNVVVVYPVSGGPTYEGEKKIKEYDRGWMAEGDDFNKMHNEVLTHLQNDMGLDPVNIIKVTAQGHSAGGLALTNIAESGTGVVKEYLYLDASYTNWAERAYDHSRDETSGSPDIFLVIAHKNDSKGSPRKWLLEDDAGSSWHEKLLQKGNEPYSTGIDGVYLHVEKKSQHGQLPETHTGKLGLVKEENARKEE